MVADLLGKIPDADSQRERFRKVRKRKFPSQPIHSINGLDPPIGDFPKKGLPLRFRGGNGIGAASFTGELAETGIGHW